MKKLILLLTILLFTSPCYALQAFPGAEGFGSDATGGRYNDGDGTDIYIVSSTASGTGAGTLGECIAASGSRICVFSTGGSIASSYTISNPHITIAGQTAPGGGITIQGGLVVDTHNVIIRYITVRNNDANSGSDAIGIWDYNDNSGGAYDVIIDHVTASWGVDETFSTWYGAHDNTISWCIISEGLNCSSHSGGCHSKGLLIGGPIRNNEGDPTHYRGAYNITAHHNLTAHHGERQPLTKTSGLVDVVNNVMYDSLYDFGYFEWEWDDFAQVAMELNYVGNYYKRGPSSGSSDEISCKDNGGVEPDGVHTYGNIGPNRTSDVQDQNLVLLTSGEGAVNCRNYYTATPYSVSQPVTATTAFQAYDQVLALAGNSKKVNCYGYLEPRRDAIDARIVSEVIAGTGGLIDTIIYEEGDCAGNGDPIKCCDGVDSWSCTRNYEEGYISVAAGSACADTDTDGMPDAFELKWFGDLDETATGDFDGDGYFNIEEYFNGTSGNASMLLASPGNFRFLWKYFTNSARLN